MRAGGKKPGYTSPEIGLSGHNVTKEGLGECECGGTNYSFERGEQSTDSRPLFKSQNFKFGTMQRPGDDFKM